MSILDDSIELDHAKQFHPRAMKLIAKKKNFIVVADDEPYFMVVYHLIRTHERSKGTWTEQDGKYYREYIERGNLQ